MSPPSQHKVYAIGNEALGLRCDMATYIYNASVQCSWLHSCSRFIHELNMAMRLVNLTAPMFTS